LGLSVTRLVYTGAPKSNYLVPLIDHCRDSRTPGQRGPGYTPPGEAPGRPFGAHPRAWAALAPTPAPRYPEKGFPGVPPAGVKKGAF